MKSFKKYLNEMDGDGSGRDGSNRKRIGSYGQRDRDIPGPDIHHGPKDMMTKKQITNRAIKTLNKAFKKVNEDGGMGAGAVGGSPTNNVGGVAGTGDSRLPASQREPGVLRKRKTNLFKRK